MLIQSHIYNIYHHIIYPYQSIFLSRKILYNYSQMLYSRYIFLSINILSITSINDITTLGTLTYTGNIPIRTATILTPIFSVHLPRTCTICLTPTSLHPYSLLFVPSSKTFYIKVIYNFLLFFTSKDEFRSNTVIQIAKPPYNAKAEIEQIQSCVNV